MQIVHTRKGLILTFRTVGELHSTVGPALADGTALRAIVIDALARSAELISNALDRAGVSHELPERDGELKPTENIVGQPHLENPQ
jgi:hypothetical protein